MTRLLLLIGLATSLIAIVPTPAAAAPGRWALVIGNDTYSAVQSLRNAGADADLIGGRLRAGFSVINTKNATRRAMLRAVLDLSRRAEGGGELVLYYAGHGVQVANTNYLLPVDFESTEPSLLSHESLSLSDILVTLQEAKPRFALVIVDACRDNPLAGKKGRNLDIQKGLSPMQPATGQMIVFSAGNGQVALDRTGTDQRDVNGLFAQELAKQIRRPGLDIRDMMVAIRSSVEARAAAVQHAQRPAIYDESSGQFAFYPQSIPEPARAEPARPQVPVGPSTGAHYRSAEEIEDELWRLLSESRSPEAYAAYLREYPSGRYAASARVRQELFRSAAARTAPTTGSLPAPAPGPSSPPPAMPFGSGIDRERERPRPAPAAEPRPPTSDAIATAPPSAPITQPDGDPTARQLVGRRFAGRNGGYSLELAFEKGGARVHRFIGPASISVNPGSAVGATTGQGLAIRCGFAGWVYLSENKEFSARCNAEDGPRTGISISGTFPHLKIEQYGRRGADVLELQEVR